RRGASNFRLERALGRGLRLGRSRGARQSSLGRRRGHRPYRFISAILINHLARVARSMVAASTVATAQAAVGEAAGSAAWGSASETPEVSPPFAKPARTANGT